MSTFKQIPLDDIHVPKRLRKVEEGYASVLQLGIDDCGLLSPINVRSTPNAKKGSKPYTLAAGAHRYHAVKALGHETIPALVVKADAEKAQLIEIEENLFRNELSVLDRAIFLQAYRELWERQNGKINPKGGRPKNSLNLTELISSEAAQCFSSYVSERLGLSVSTMERANQIAKSLPANLREKLRGTPAADNQSLLLKFAKLPPSKLKVAAQTFDLAKGDAEQTLALLEDKPQGNINPLEKTIGQLDNKVGALSEADRREAFRRLVKYYEADIQWALNNPISDDTEGGQ